MAANLQGVERAPVSHIEPVNTRVKQAEQFLTNSLRIVFERRPDRAVGPHDTANQDALESEECFGLLTQKKCCCPFPRFPATIQ